MNGTQGTYERLLSRCILCHEVVDEEIRQPVTCGSVFEGFCHPACWSRAKARENYLQYERDRLEDQRDTFTDYTPI